MNITDYKLPVHKSFQQPDLLLGVSKNVFMILFVILVIVSYLFTLLIGIVTTLVFYIPCYFLTKHDPNMLTIALNSIFEPDELEG